MSRRSAPRLHHSLPGATPTRPWKKIFFWTAVLLGLAVVAALTMLIEPDIPAAEIEARWANEDSRFAEIGGTRVHYRDQAPEGLADPPVLLLLHGTSSSLHTWDGWVEALGDRYRLVRLDLQGYGLTGPNPEHDYSIGRQVEVIESLVDLLDIDRLAVAGNSLGGLIAWRYGARHPERVSHLVLLDPAGAPAAATAAEASSEASSRGFRMIDLARIPVLRELLTKITPRSVIRSSLEQVYGDPSKVTEARITRYHEMLLREGNRQALVASMSARSRAPAPDATSDTAPPPTLADVEQPTLILWGSEDRWIPVSHGARFSDAIEGSELVIYEGVGHLPMEEIPSQSARDAARFLEDHGFGVTLPPPAALPMAGEAESEAESTDRSTDRSTGPEPPPNEPNTAAADDPRGRNSEGRTAAQRGRP